MSTPRFDIFETYAQEHNQHILKVSNDARLLRSLSKVSVEKPKELSPRASRPMLMSILGSLIYVFKQLPA
jgi:hypothetical protein